VTQTRPNIKNPAGSNLDIDILCPSLSIRGQLPARIVNGGGVSFCKLPDFQLWKARAWPWPWIGSYCIPSCIIHRPLPTRQISSKSKKLFVDWRTYARTDGQLRPALLGRLCRRVDLKSGWAWSLYLAHPIRWWNWLMGSSVESYLSLCVCRYRSSVAQRTLWHAWPNQQCVIISWHSLVRQLAVSRPLHRPQTLSMTSYSTALMNLVTVFS